MPDDEPRVREPRRQQCDTGCGTEIVDFSGALTIQLHGGYGMFFDDLGMHAPATLTICHDCTGELFEFYGRFPKVIAEATGFPHEAEGGKWHPDEVATNPDRPCPWCYNWQEEADQQEAEEFRAAAEVRATEYIEETERLKKSLDT